MTINITGRHMDVTDALRGHVEERIRHAASEWPRIGNVHVVLNLEKKTRCIAEVVFRAPRHGTVEARAESHDMYRSIDLAIERADRQVRRWKQKLKDSHKTRAGLGRVERTIQDREG